MKGGQPEWSQLSPEEQKSVQKMHASKTKTLLDEHLRKDLV